MPKRTRSTPQLDTVQNARRVFLEAVESTETVKLTIVQKVMREMGAKGGKIGGKRRLYIPWQLAYGDRGQPPTIPARAELIFDIEILSQSDNPPAPKTPPTPPPAAKPTTPPPAAATPPPAAKAPAAAAPAPATTAPSTH